MKKILIATFCALIAFISYGAESCRFSTAGFHSIPDSGRDVYSMNPGMAIS